MNFAGGLNDTFILSPATCRTHVSEAPPGEVFPVLADAIRCCLLQ